MGAGVFGAKGLREHLELVVADLRREMFTSTADPVLAGGEEAAKAIAKTISGTNPEIRARSGLIFV